MGKPQEEESPKPKRVRRVYTYRDHTDLRFRSKVLDDRREICREAYQDFLEMLREAVEEMK